MEAELQSRRRCGINSACPATHALDVCAIRAAHHVSIVPGKQLGVYLKREADATVAERKAAHSVTPKVACFVGLDKGLRLFSNKRPREHLLRPWAWSERS